MLLAPHPWLQGPSAKALWRPVLPLLGLMATSALMASLSFLQPPQMGQVTLGLQYPPNRKPHTSHFS